jgi:hypothetical protein
MVFASDLDTDAHAVMAFDALQEMVENLVEADRWLFETGDRLMKDVEDCGPGVTVELLAAA